MKRNTLEQLRQQISMLEKKQDLELQQLHVALKDAYDSIKLRDLVKEGVSEVVEHSDIKDKIVNNTIGAATGFLAKRILLGSKLGPLGGIVGLALQLGVSNLVTNNMDNIKSAGKRLLNRSDKKQSDEET